jgi:regulator of cell morphogenesis and NO signaling
MQAVGTQTVAELAAGSLAAVRVFEKYGIDYCCGGKRPLGEACREKGINEASVQADLDTALAGDKTSDRDWNTAPLSDLIQHIVTTHHEYLRRELPAIQIRLDKVYAVYNQRYGPTLTGLPEVYAALRSELESHVDKEEMILFPAIAAYESAVNSGRPTASLPFRSVANPVSVMEAEHESAGQALSKIREITHDFEVPEYGCVTYHALMSSLDELERDLHMHIHLENNILFPRGEQLERGQ